jgi:hypothetical protein
MTDRWATFDCYGTLVDWESGMRRALASVVGDRADDVLRTYYEAATCSGSASVPTRGARRGAAAGGGNPRARARRPAARRPRRDTPVLAGVRRHRTGAARPLATLPDRLDALVAQ